MHQWRALRLIAVTAITITGISIAASAQTYPERPVKLVTQAGGQRAGRDRPHRHRSPWAGVNSS
jgi:hypothetical protein